MNSTTGLTPCPSHQLCRTGYCASEEDTLYAIYEQDGVTGVENHADAWHPDWEVGYCEPCEQQVPIYDGVCAVCWTPQPEPCEQCEAEDKGIAYPSDDTIDLLDNRGFMCEMHLSENGVSEGGLK